MGLITTSGDAAIARCSPTKQRVVLVARADHMDEMTDELKLYCQNGESAATG